MASSALAANPSPLQLGGMDHREMDAARALLGVSPGSMDAVESPSSVEPQTRSAAEATAATATTCGGSTDEMDLGSAENEAPIVRRPRSDSAGLDALAALAYQEQASMLPVDGESRQKNTDEQQQQPGGVASSRGEQQQQQRKTLTPFLVSSAGSSCASSSSEDEDSSSMPPPPPRRRPRSASNPEGMQKWLGGGSASGRGLLLAAAATNSPPNDLHAASPVVGSGGRRHFVLPASILEVELAEASAAVKEQRKKKKRRCVSIPEEHEYQSGDDGAGGGENGGSNDPANEPDAEVVDEANMTPEELLRRARSRLLEDLSQGNVHGEKGVLTLPHSLAKYKEIYNQNGRIGIYTPAERAAIIARFQRKRTRRVWNKKIRYGCRKNLADRRLRVKGRFVKRSEQEQLAKQLAEKAAAKEAAQESDDGVPVVVGQEQPNAPNGEQPDQDMPDVNDPEAGFAPTEDQPYRRLRRYTIT